MENSDELFIDSVSCRFGDRMILQNVYISCKPGEVVGLLGRNGCGKSTLLRIIFGLLKGFYKHCKVNGKIFSKGYRTGRIAYLPQDNLLPRDITVADAAKMLVRQHAPAFYGLELIQQYLQSRVSALSGGERRMVETLLILYSDAQYVLLDEPFSNIAPLYVEQIQQHIGLLKPLKGFIVTDHYYQRILEISDRVTLIHNGCNYQINSKEDLSLHGYIPSASLD